MTMGLYGGFIERLSRKVEARLDDIEAVFNFDLGDEFEIALCMVLEDLLPEKFGVCRGFVVSSDGEKAGDDVIIYDKLACPTLRPGSGIRFATKEQIPIEGVYAYIECKHAIKDEEVFKKAIEQSRTVKALLHKRRKLKNPDYNPEGVFYRGKVHDWPRPYPPNLNQPFCAVFSRHFDPTAVVGMVHDAKTPDLLVLGKGVLATQSALLGPDGIKGALFIDPLFQPGLRLESVDGQAFGLGLVTLLQALSWIRLDPVDWQEALNKSFADIVLGPTKPK